MVFAIIVGIPSSLGFGIWDQVKIIGMSILDFFDFLSNSVIMPIVALATCLFVGFIIKPSAIVDEVKESSEFKSQKWYTVMIKWIAPICIIAILISSVLSALGYMSI